MSVIGDMKVVNEKYKITGLDNGYLIEIEAEDEVGNSVARQGKK